MELVLASENIWVLKPSFSKEMHLRIVDYEDRPQIPDCWHIECNVRNHCRFMANKE